MKEFNLEKALAGAKMVFRNGDKVFGDIFAPDCRKAYGYPLVLITSQEYSIYSFKGEFSSTQSPFDLFMDYIRVKKYIYVRNPNSLGVCSTTNAYNTIDELKLHNLVETYQGSIHGIYVEE